MTEASRDRTRLAGLVLCGVFVLMAGRGGYLALSDAPVSAAATQAAPEARAPGARADIIDRNGELLVTSVETYALWADPSQIWDAGDVTERLGTVLPDISPALARRLADTSLRQVPIRRGLTPRQLNAVLDLKLEGLGYTPELRRAYPHGAVASQVLGQLNSAGEGVAGVELTFDRRLRAEDRALQLSLDVEAQTALEAEMAAAAETFEMAGGAAILMAVGTGEIFAMASWPAFDPNQAARVSPDHTSRLNRAVGAVYELGSVFKPLTVAAALDAGAVAPSTVFDVSAPVKVGAFEVSDTHRFASKANVTDIIVESSNIGTVHIARKLGVERHLDFLEASGLLARADIELPGSAAPLGASRIDANAAATIGYGHGLAVSPLAFLAAFAALGNDGEMMQPTLLHDGQKRPAPVRLMSAETAAAVVTMMRDSVLRGSGKPADIPGYRVAGKTGTGEKAVKGGYDRNANVSSFAAVFPADRPEYALIVTLDNPRAREGRGATAAVSAAPVAGRIIERVAPILGVAPRVEDVRPADAKATDRTPERTRP